MQLEQGNRIRVVPHHSLPSNATVYRNNDVIGFLVMRGTHHYPSFKDRPGTHWFSQLTSALQYLITGEANDNGRLIVSERGDVAHQKNGPAVSFGDVCIAAELEELPALVA